MDCLDGKTPPVMVVRDVIKLALIGGRPVKNSHDHETSVFENMRYIIGTLHVKTKVGERPLARWMHGWSGTCVFFFFSRRSAGDSVSGPRELILLANCAR